MDCTRIREILSEYIDGYLEEDIRSEIQKHIDGCSTCRAEYEMMIGIKNSCSKLDEIDLPEDFHCILMNRLEEEKKAERNIRRRNAFRRYIGPVAAVLILAISIGMVFNSGMLGSLKKSESMTTAQSAKNSNAKSVPESANGLAADNVNIMSGKMDTGMVYNTIVINLTDDEYKKNFSDIAVIIEGLEGYITQKDPVVEYMMPKKNVDALIKKLKESYNIEDIPIISTDYSSKYNELKSEISELEQKKSSGSSQDGSNMDDQLKEKKNELKDMEDKAGYVTIRINRN